MIIVLQSLSYRNNYSHFQNNDFKTFWSPERDSETILSVGIFELYSYNVKYSTMLCKAYKVCFRHSESRIIAADNISELIKNLETQEVIAIFKLSYFYSILCPAEFLQPIQS